MMVALVVVVSAVAVTVVVSFCFCVVVVVSFPTTVAVFAMLPHRCCYFCLTFVVDGIAVDAAAFCWFFMLLLLL